MALLTLQDKKARAIEAFGQGCTWEEAATACSVSRMTLWRWGRRDPEFLQAIREAGADADAEVEATTFQNAVDPDPAHNTLRMFWLKSRVPGTYMDRQDVTSKGEKLEASVQFNIIDNGRNDLQTPAGPPDGIPGDPG